MLNQVATGLIKRELFGLGGELFEAVGQSERAMSCYRKGANYRQAVELARQYFPNEAKGSKFMLEIKTLMSYLKVVGYELTYLTVNHVNP